MNKQSHFEFLMDEDLKTAESCIIGARFHFEKLIGTEDFSSSLHSIMAITKKIGEHLGRALRSLAGAITKIVLISARKSEHILKSYSALSDVWNTRLSGSASNINDEKFEKTVVTMVPKKVLEDRIDIVKLLAKSIETTRAICEAPITTSMDGIEWGTKDLVEIHRKLHSLGIDIGKLSLTGKVKGSTYETHEQKASLGDLGYTSHDVKTLIGDIDDIIEIAEPKYVVKMSNLISSYFAELAKQETAANKLVEEGHAGAEEALRIIEVKTTRLWNVLTFVKIMNKVTADVVDDVFKLCRIAAKNQEA